ncbi:CHAT domain-containing protein [Fuerstiella marisgermanici]|uniref:CHAT domain protein n=1 Tax=Fuerstiella marisgermanici TaxID=1891926 RepID=A0A1P8WGS7_9PLAN|nr:CHAT domain-containing tetratricopeptide repeat protein [Fuerstiella marisgermanici]APZ93254.1 CHAT domain protein [Fuerstiella marisgermanici]
MQSPWVAAETGDFQQSVLWYDQALIKVPRSVEVNSEQFVRLQHNLAVLATRLGKPEEAVSHFAKAIEYGIRANDPVVRQMRISRGNTLRVFGRFEDAALELRQARESLSQAGPRETKIRINALTESSIVAALSGDFTNSEQLLIQAKRAFSSASDERRSLTLRQEVGYAQAILHYQREEISAAIDSFQAVLDDAITEMQIASEYQTPRQQVAAANQAREYLDATVTMLERKPGAASRVYRFVPGFKSISWQIAREWRRALRENAARGIHTSLGELSEAIADISRDISRETFRVSSNPEANSEDWDQIQADRVNQLETLRGRKGALQRKLAGLLTDMRQKRADDDQQKLFAAIPQHGVIVEFVTYHRRPWVQAPSEAERLAAFLIRSDGSIRFVPLPLSDAEVTDVVKEWARKSYSQCAELNQVRAAVWTPVENALTDADKLVFLCPEGATTLVPFGALPGRDSGKFLIEEERRLTQLPTPLMLLRDSLLDGNASASDSLGIADSQSRSVRDAAAHRNSIELLLVGDVHFGIVETADSVRTEKERKVRSSLMRWQPIKGAAREVYAARNAFESAYPSPDAEYRVLTRTLASKDIVTRLLRKTGHVHFATHGFYGRELGNTLFKNRWRAADSASFGPATMEGLYPGVLSGLALANANRPNDDGLLTAHEISQMELSNLHTVVLSACETAVGDYSRGEGQMSLQWAFHRAGAKSCVSSLWKVPDAATSRLMDKFYEYLWNGETKLEALRSAQIWVLRNPDATKESSRGATITEASSQNLNSPYFWAAFQLSGDWR